MSFSAASLSAVLETHVPPAATGLAVALSGGLDSVCLLTALSQIRDCRLPVRALHVDHGLQTCAAEFRRVCTGLCERVGIPLPIIEAWVTPARGESIEAAARRKRYAALERELSAGECLLTAHHATDQAETVLLQLLRGAGLKGLSAMPLCRSLGAGWHLRPLLGTSKRDLERFGAEARIAAVDDPMNADLRFDRAHLRARVWPAIVDRWPGAAAALSRTARHAADAQSLLDETAAVALRTLRDGDGLSITGLRALSLRQQLNAMRHWIDAAGATVPPTARLVEALRQISEAEEDHLPAVVWGGHALRRYRDRVFVTPADPPRLAEAREWPVLPGSILELGGQLGSLRWSEQPGGLDVTRLPPTVEVRRRSGGETLKPHRRARTQTVQHLCQSLGVPPWMRDALPLIYAGNALISIGDFWQDARWTAPEGQSGLRVVWHDGPIFI